MNKRGTFGFEVEGNGNLANSAKNVVLLRKLWLDRDLVQGYYLGPGDPGDSDHGAGHSACHLVAAGGVAKSRAGNLLWFEISYDERQEDYFASVSVQKESKFLTLKIDSAEGREILTQATILGFVEGNSQGRISAQGVIDPPSLFNACRRQDYDRPAADPGEGGKVWEHWCTLRDIRESARIGMSVLTAYVSLVSVLGDLFPAVVARGRKEYGHPEQLCAMVQAGFVSRESALKDISPAALDPNKEIEFKSAIPKLALNAILSVSTKFQGDLITIN